MYIAVETEFPFSSDVQFVKYAPDILQSCPTLSRLTSKTAPLPLLRVMDSKETPSICKWRGVVLLDTSTLNSGDSCSVIFLKRILFRDRLPAVATINDACKVVVEINSIFSRVNKAL